MKTDLTTQEQLFEWWQNLPFEALEKIHNVVLFGLDEETTEEVLDECRDDWFSMEDTQKENVFINYYDVYAYITGDYDKLFDELYNS
jgi:hypothetical protein